MDDLPPDARGEALEIDRRIELDALGTARASLLKLLSLARKTRGPCREIEPGTIPAKRKAGDK